jgi:DMSO/TMAO reductase YedYZ molybdopterin-dependent catalytic subunit
VRVVVPGYIGARSVKWVTAVTVQAVPSDNYFQASDYRILPPDGNPDTAPPGEGIPLSSLVLNCDILVPGGPGTRHEPMDMAAVVSYRAGPTGAIKPDRSGLG